MGLQGEPVTGNLQDASHLMAPVVEQTISALNLSDKDAAAAQIARRYAACIDWSLRAGPDKHAWALRWIGPLLQTALDDLGATPAARGRIKTGAPAPSGQRNRVTAIREARRGA